MLKVISFLSMILGLGIIYYVTVPLISYALSSSSKFATYLTPVPAGEEILQSGKQKDFTKASNWFPEDEDSAHFETSRIGFYTLSIAKLGIKQATVSIGGEDLTQSLIQYPGTALPGKRGNAVIFGHSVLPQFFNPENYVSIFSTLPKLKKDDLIELYFDGILYEYRIENMFEVKPTDLQILEQNSSDAFVTLVTCVPPGLKTKRLIVRARLEKPFQDLSSNEAFSN